MRRLYSWAWAGAVALLPACALVSGLGSLEIEGVDSGPPDATDVATADAAPPDAPADGPLPTGCVATGPCTQSIPAGWTAVAAPDDPNASCPSGFATSDRVVQVTAGVGACGCGCSVTKDPACDVGTLQRHIGDTTNCTNVGATLSANGPACTATGQPLSITAYAKVTTPGPTGGTCVASAVEDKTKVTRSSLRTCAAAACAETVCNGALKSNLACVVKDGNEPTCPTGFAAKRTVVGNDFTLGCSACTCDVNGASSCVGGMLRYYSDSQCTTQVASVSANNTCNLQTGSGTFATYFKYSATLTKVCSSTGPKTAAPALVGVSTVCCK